MTERTPTDGPRGRLLPPTLPDRQPPVHLTGPVAAIRQVGAYQVLTVVATEIAARARPGQFVALRVGGPDTGLLLRRAFSIHAVRPTGPYGGTVDVVVGVAGVGTAWLAARRAGDTIDIVGPLGAPFRLPAEPGPAVLVGGGYGSAPLFWLAEELRAAGSRPSFALGAASADRLFGALEARRIGAQVRVTTDDGSAGAKGVVTDPLPELVERTGARAVYACGPMPMLRAVTEVCDVLRLPAQVAVEESMACGIGVCMTCVLPVVGDDRRTRMVRACTEGPVFDGGRVRWADVGRVPSDAVGAPATEGAA